MTTIGADPRCSVVVPVWNPGPNLVRCVDSLLGQTMPTGDYEIVMVDDGSTDGTAARLDALAEAHPGHVRVLHGPHSGWPGRPRNIGIEAARGTYIHFVDNDDVLPPSALQAMCDAADVDRADVVLGRPASDFRGINHAIYRDSRRGITLAQYPDLVETTTPHKMFRRTLLTDHGIRFPEAMPHEDQVFVLQAYLRAASITVLTDRCYYFYLRRLGSGRNAGDRSLDPAAQFHALERVLDVIDAGVPDPELRDRLARRFFRVELLNQLWTPGMRDASPDRQRYVFAETRRLVTARFAPGVRAGSGAVHRTMATLVANDDLPGTLAFADRCRRMGLHPSATGVTWRDGTLAVDVDATLQHREAPLRCEATGNGWALPEALAPGIPVAERLLDRARDHPDAELMLVSRIDSVTTGLGRGLRVEVDGGGVIRATGTAVIDPATALFGGPLPDGVWDLRLRVWFAGISRSLAVRVEPSAAAGLLPLIADGVRSVRPFVGRHHRLAIDVGEWLQSWPASLAPGSELEAAGPSRLRLTVAAEFDAPTPVRLWLLPSDTMPGIAIDCRGMLSGTSTGMAEATVPLPPGLPPGRWRPWLEAAGPSAAAPVALPWLVHRSPAGLRVEPAPLATGNDAP